MAISYGIITIEDKKVYYTGKADDILKGNNLLLYDFGLKVGDTFYVGDEKDNKYNRPFILISIDSVLIDNEYRKKYNFYNSKYSEFSFIETIGCTIYLFHTMNPFQHELSKFHRLGRVYYKDKLIWER